MLKISAVLASLTTMIACVGCDALSIASQVTSTIIDSAVILGGIGVLFNISSITDFIQNLIGGL